MPGNVTRHSNATSSRMELAAAELHIVELRAMGSSEVDHQDSPIAPTFPRRQQAWQ